MMRGSEESLRIDRSSTLVQTRLDSDLFVLVSICHVGEPNLWRLASGPSPDLSSVLMADAGWRRAVRILLGLAIGVCGTCSVKDSRTTVDYGRSSLLQSYRSLQAASQK